MDEAVSMRIPRISFHRHIYQSIHIDPFSRRRIENLCLERILQRQL